MEHELIKAALNIDLFTNLFCQLTYWINMVTLIMQHTVLKANFNVDNFPATEKEICSLLDISLSLRDKAVQKWSIGGLV